jgi:hypothetical protein
MYPNIACSVSGCTNPVIGQCPGYKGGCGRYYCATHGSNGLCADCARRKLEDEIYKDYLQTAERLRREVGRVGLPISLGILMVSFIIAFAIGQDYDSAVVCAIPFSGMILGLLLALPRQHKREELRLEEIRKTKPGFPEFYRAWKKKKNKEELLTGLSIAGAIVVAAIAGAASDLAKDAEREERVREVEEGVRRAL